MYRKMHNLMKQNPRLHGVNALYVASNAGKLFSSKARLEVTVKEYMRALSHNPSLLSSREVDSFLKHKPFGIHWDDSDTNE